MAGLRNLAAFAKQNEKDSGFIFSISRKKRVPPNISLERKSLLK